MAYCNVYISMKRKARALLHGPLIRPDAHAWHILSVCLSVLIAQHHTSCWTSVMQTTLWFYFLKCFWNRNIFGPKVYWIWSPFKKAIAAELVDCMNHFLIALCWRGKHTVWLKATSQVIPSNYKVNTVKLRGTVRQHSQVTGYCQTTQWNYRGLPDNIVK